MSLEDFRQTNFGCNFKKNKVSEIQANSSERGNSSLVNN